MTHHTVVRRIIGILLVLLAAKNVAAQPLSTAYHDTFDDNKGEWQVGGSLGRSASIVNGVYRVDQRAAFGTWFAKTNCFVDYAQDFEVEVKVRQLAGSNAAGFGIFWSGKGINAYNDLIVSGIGRYRVTSESNGAVNDMQPWTPFEGMPPLQTWFTMTIRKRGSGMSVLVNNTTLFAFDRPRIFGGEIGLLIGPQVVVEFADFIVRQNQGPIALAEDCIIDGKPESLGPNVNSTGGDISPVITADGKRLYFGRYPYLGNIGDPSTEDIWYTDLQPNGTWGPAQNIGAPLNNYASNFLVSISPDRNSAIVGNTYYSNGAPKGAGLSSTYMTENGWSIPKEIRIDRYYNDDQFSELCLDPSGMILVMTVQRDDTKGQKDIYFARRKPNGMFSEPVNCGPVLNTWGNEISPFVAADGVTLFFATDGRKGYGDMDIWMSRRLDDTWTKWSEPKNVGPLINTTQWDAYFTIPAKADYAYFSGASPADGSSDLYRARLPKGLKPLPVALITGRVLDAATKKPIATAVSYESLTKGVTAGIARSEPTKGSYSIVLPVGDLYGFRAELEGFYPVSDQLDTRSLAEYTEITRDLYLAPIAKNQTITLNNVFFDFRQSVLRPESHAELDRLAAFLIQRPTMVIELAGHTDNIGSAGANMDLSRQRVNAVKEYLVTRGVEAARMKTVAHGATKPLVKNNSDDARRRNRRVEFRIVAI
jgi:outer membrane protein OmpA-like peptidoglycan-associated protein